MQKAVGSVTSGTSVTSANDSRIDASTHLVDGLRPVPDTFPHSRTYYAVLFHGSRELFHLVLPVAYRLANSGRSAAYDVLDHICAANTV